MQNGKSFRSKGRQRGLRSPRNESGTFTSRSSSLRIRRYIQSPIRPNRETRSNYNDASMDLTQTLQYPGNWSKCSRRSANNINYSGHLEAYQILLQNHPHPEEITWSYKRCNEKINQSRADNSKPLQNPNKFALDQTISDPIHELPRSTKVWK